MKFIPYALILSTFLWFPCSLSQVSGQGNSSSAQVSQIQKTKGDEPVPSQIEFVTPEQKLLGVDRPVELGDLVDVSVSPIKPKPAYLAGVDYLWKVYDNGHEKKVRKDGDGIFFGSGVTPRVLQVHCIITYLYIANVNGEIKAGTRTVLLSSNLTVGNPGPTPPQPGPNPGPQPGPVTPTFSNSQFNLEMPTWQSATRTVTDRNALINGSKAYSTAVKGMASSIGAGAFQKMEDALKQSQQSFASALRNANVSADSWEDFGLDMQKNLYDLYKNKKLNTLPDLAEAFNEIARGLEAVK